VIVSIASKQPQPLREISSEVPERLDQIVSKALAKDLDKRYQSADELLLHLKTLRRDLEIESGVKRVKPPTPISRTRKQLIIPLVVIALIIIAGFIYTRFSRQTVSSSEFKSLAVLPLDNLSGDASQEYFADGMTDALITDFAKIGALRVISRPSVMQYKGAKKPVQEISRELNVDALLTGSVIRAGDKVRITVQLFSASGENLWADSYERDLRDTLALQRDVTQDIVGKIRIKLTPQEQGKFGKVVRVDPDAYDSYLKGKFYLNVQDRAVMTRQLRPSRTQSKKTPSLLVRTPSWHRHTCGSSTSSSQRILSWPRRRILKPRKHSIKIPNLPWPTWHAAACFGLPLTISHTRTRFENTSSPLTWIRIWMRPGISLRLSIATSARSMSRLNSLAERSVRTRVIASPNSGSGRL
jgi:TolB-like protein